MALQILSNGGSIRKAKSKTAIPVSSLSRIFKEFKDTNQSITTFVDNVYEEPNRLVVLTKEEELAINKYILWKAKQGFPVKRKHV